MIREWRKLLFSETVLLNPPMQFKHGEHYPFVDMDAVVLCSCWVYPAEEREFSDGDSRFQYDDTLMARITPCLENGKTTFMDFLENEQVGGSSTQYIVLRPKSLLPEEFGYCLAWSEAFREFAIQSMTGTSGRQRVQANSLAHFKLPRAPGTIAQEFGRLVKPLFARSSQAVRKSHTLAALRDALLPKLISDALRMKDTERFLKKFTIMI